MQNMRARQMTASVIISLLCCIGGYGQNDDSGYNDGAKYRIERFYVSDGLCGNKVLDICQDAFGRMWFGTTAGVSRYDGATFTDFGRNIKNNFHISHNNAQVLLALDNGDVWIGTPDSLNIYEYEYDRVIRPDEDDGLQYSDITALCKSRDGNTVWIGTYGNGIVRYDSKSRRFDSINYSNICHSGYITALMEDSNEYLWIGTRYDGLFKMDLRTNKCTKLTQENCSYVRKIFQDRSGNVWAATDEGLFYAKGDIIERIHLPKPDSRPIVCITEDKDNRIWIGGSNLCMNFPANELIRNDISSGFEIEDGPLQSHISYKSIHSIYCDSSGNIWAGSYGGGVNMISHPDTLISQIYPGSEQNGLNGSINKTLAICSDKEENLWFGMDGSGLIRYNRKTKEKKHFAIHGNTEDIIQAILVDNNGNIWTGSYTSGLAVLDRNHKITHFPTGQTGSTVRSIFEDSKGTVYIGSEKGLSKMADDGTFLNICPNYDIRALKEDKYGSLWLATYGNGVVKYDPITGKILEIGKTDGLNSQIVFDLTISNDTVWCATSYGVNAINADGKILDIPESLYNINSVSITHDNNGNIWVASQDIIKIEKGLHNIKHYPDKKINDFGDFSEGAVCTTEDGKIFFGGFNGTIVIDSDKEIPTDNRPRPIIFTDLKIFDQSIIPEPSGKRNRTLCKNINLQDKIILKPWQNVFSIEFASPEYMEQPEYEYILKGIDNSWNELGNTNAITFRNLPAGKYELGVRSHLAGSKVYSHNSVQFIIRPYWYNTVAAKTGLIIIILAIVVLVYSYYASKLKFSYTLAIEKDKRLKEEELHDAKLTFFTNISHELRTPLTLLLAPLEQLIDNETNSTKLNNLKIINKNANRLLSLVNQVLDFRKSEKGQMHLKIREIQIEEYIGNIVGSFSELANERRIAFNATISNPTMKRIWADPDIIDKICLNLLSNAFKFTDCGGKIHIGVTTTDNELHLCITDTGQGIAKNAQERVFDRFWQENKNMDSFSYKTAGSGIGLHLVKSLTELHHGTITLKSELGKGSEFMVILPCIKDEYDATEIDCSTECRFIDAEADKTDVAIPDQSSRPTIIICDDNDEILDYLCEALGFQYNVIRCNSGEDALEATGKYPEIDMLICDIMMPGINGLEVCRKLKSTFETNHIPVILLTAKSGMDDMLEGLECGADAYISKPFKLSHLKVQIKQILASRETLRHKYQKNIIFEAGESEPNENEEDRFIHSLNQAVLSNINDTNLTGETLCKSLNLSRSSLHRKLKALTGLSSGDYIRNLRLGKAAEMLTNSDKTISEICYMTGFSSPSYFTSCFKNQFNVSPKEYRIRHAQDT